LYLENGLTLLAVDQLKTANLRGITLKKEEDLKNGLVVQLSQIARMALIAGQLSDVKFCIDTALGYTTLFAETWVVYGHYMAAMSDPFSAIGYFKKALTLDSRPPLRTEVDRELKRMNESFFKEAVQAYRQRKWSKSIALLQLCLKIDASQQEVLFWLRKARNH